MLLAMKIKAAITAAALASPIALTIAPAGSLDVSTRVPRSPKSQQSRSSIGSPATSPATASPRQPRCAMPASPPHQDNEPSGYRGEYARCADDGGCPKIPHAPAMRDRPMVGVSWRDATAYAEWMTNKTGVVHRLPTDEEWVFAAADKARDEALPLVDPIDPRKPGSRATRRKRTGRVPAPSTRNRSAASAATRTACRISVAISGNGPTAASFA